MKKNRLYALDGIRGLAAINVVMFHIDLFKRFTNHISSPVLVQIFNSFAAGNNAVQIYFVLSGFLIAYLYPKINNKIDFIKRRYARILPIYCVVIFFIWLVSQNKIIHKLPSQIVVLSLIVIAAHYILLKIYKASKENKTIIFFIYLFFQATTLFYGICLIIWNKKIIPEPRNSFLTLISNLSLTFPFVGKISGLTIVSWSLVFELIFYIVYPLIIINVIAFCKNRKLITNLLVVSFIIFVLFMLENILPTIARSSSFIFGICAGTIYQSNSYIWKSIKGILEKPAIGMLILITFLATQWSDLNAINIPFLHLSNSLYLLLLNLIIVLLILTSIIPGTLLNKFFNFKILLFSGLISYSSYLVHNFVIDWNFSIFERFSSSILSPYLPWILLSSTIITTVLISYLLFKFIERIRFNKIDI